MFYPVWWIQVHWIWIRIQGYVFIFNYCEFIFLIFHLFASILSFIYMRGSGSVFGIRIRIHRARVCGSNTYAISFPPLYQRIDLAKLSCLNETVDNSGRTVFKPFEQRRDRSQFVESDADEELLFNIPFTGNVKLKGIRYRCLSSLSFPLTDKAMF